MMMHCDYMKATALANTNPPLLLSDYNRLEQDVSKEFRWFLIGLTCLLARDKNFKSEHLNHVLTQAQIAKNSGYGKNSLKRFACYAKAIIKIQLSLPNISADVLTGKIMLSMKTAIDLAKLKPEEIIVIAERMKTEQISVHTALEKQNYHLKTHSYSKSGKRSVKISPKSVKDIPRYDPDAQVAVLTYTIPSWTKAINRLQNDGKLHEISSTARLKLGDELTNLKSIIEALTDLILEARS